MKEFGLFGMLTIFFLARELVRMESERGVVNNPCETGLQMAGCHPHGASHSLEEKL